MIFDPRLPNEKNPINWYSNGSLTLPLRLTKRLPYSRTIAFGQDFRDSLYRRRGHSTIFGITATYHREFPSLRIAGDARGELSIDPDSLTCGQTWARYDKTRGTIYPGAFRAEWRKARSLPRRCENSTASKWCRPKMKKNDPRAYRFARRKAICELSPAGPFLSFSPVSYKIVAVCVGCATLHCQPSSQSTCTFVHRPYHLFYFYLHTSCICREKNIQNRYIHHITFCFWILSLFTENLKYKFYIHRYLLKAIPRLRL